MFVFERIGCVLVEILQGSDISEEGNKNSSFYIEEKITRLLADFLVGRNSWLTQISTSYQL